MPVFRAYLVERDSEGRPTSAMRSVSRVRLPAGDVEFRVHYSSINYKDSLSVAGHPGITHTFPHVPGIDAAGTVTASQDGRFRPGDAILVTGFDFGMNHWGGFAEIARVPASWVMPVPEGLSMWEAMALGTAGLTVALGVDACVRNDLVPTGGPCS
ncbi:MAG: alcohol dehydrogenase catalytic domain-containing protein [Acidiferrobacteraceae bacterium]